MIFPGEVAIHKTPVDNENILAEFLFQERLIKTIVKSLFLKIKQSEILRVHGKTFIFMYFTSLDYEESIN